MKTSLVMTVIGPDRPGVVDSIAEAIVKAGGSWEESRMCHLGGQFAGLLSFSVDRERQSELAERFDALKGDGLDIVLKEARQDDGGECSRILEIDIMGQDRPGIVSQISSALAKHSVNVEELESECRSAPMSGERLFEARARVCVSASCDQAALQEDLERIAGDLMVDLSIEAS